MKLSIFSTLPQILKQEIIRYLGYSFYLECLYPYKYKKLQKINHCLLLNKKRIFSNLIKKMKKNYKKNWLG